MSTHSGIYNVRLQDVQQQQPKQRENVIKTIKQRKYMQNIPNKQMTEFGVTKKGRNGYNGISHSTNVSAHIRQWNIIDIFFRTKYKTSDEKLENFSSCCCWYFSNLSVCARNFGDIDCVAFFAYITIVLIWVDVHLILWWILFVDRHLLDCNLTIVYVTKP